MAADTQLLAAIRDGLRTAAVSERAPQMQAYMKSAMSFRGVRVPEVRAITLAAAKAHPFGSPDALRESVLALWRDARFREERYAATALLDVPNARRVRTPELLDTCRELIVTGAWWDHVDELAHRVGELLADWPGDIRAQLVGWTSDDDPWLRRASIICQLGRRDDTDLDLLGIAIEANLAHRDFFIRKAIGWALRDYARTDANWVRALVAARGDQLSALSRREALKHL
ncbi:MAG: DNA alkylation repair protein [Actinomycetota bacterium]|nr:DNA alkylation repair protein [Actinomycetota bacterium]